MTRQDLIKIFKEAKESKLGICLELDMPDQATPELIINDWSALDVKLDYYMKVYWDKDGALRHSMNDRIKIVKAYPCDYYRGE